VIGLADLRDRLAAGEALSEADRETLLEVVDAAAGDRRRLARRNDAMRQIATLLRPDGSVRARALVLADAMGRYASCGWQRDRAFAGLPARLVGRVEGDLWLLFKSYPRVPMSIRALEDILK
jgi:hypothetical protein